MSLLEDVFSLTKKEQIALLEELEKKASAPSPIALPQEVIETFELPDEIDIEDELAKIKEIVLAEIQSVTINAPKGDKGDKGDKGAVGPQGPKGADGVAGKDGKQGVDGKDGIDGISVTDARVDFDGSLVITLSNGQEINAGDVIPNDKKDLIIQSLKNSTLSLTELGIEDFLSSPTPIGDVTPNTGKFTSVTTPSVTATTNNLTLSAISTGAVNLATAGGTQFQIANTASTTNYLATTGSNGGTPALYSAGASTNIGTNIVSKGTGSVAFYTNGGVVQQVVSHTASAVNYVQVTGAATGGSPTITTQGSDTDVRLTFKSKGNAAITFQNSSNNTLFDIPNVFPAVNYFQPNASVTTQATVLKSLGTDTNISMAFQPKGTGAIDLAAGSKGVNISNGGTVTAITRTATGSNYTSFPSVAITAPTTAGGVQAVITVAQMFANTATIQAGGTGYTVGNTVTIVGGTPATGAATYTISAVSGGVVTAVTPLNFGAYTVLPTNPVSVTGGSGTGLTLNVTYGVQNFTISNAGSGYIEQPTVTFSGGGGSGAAAYATVGTTTVVRSLGATMQFNTPGGTQFAVSDSASTSAAYWQAVGGNATADLRTAGAGVIAGAISTQTAVPILFRTAFLEQFRVAHTASAVNYVQVTGGVTGGQPVISAQGSDTDINMNFASKNAGALIFNTNGRENFRVANGGTSVVNNLQVAGSGTGFGPVLQARGTDTNIDLSLTPKGTGLVRFGTYTASMAVTIQGYIEIKDSGGTIRRLAVVT